MKYHVKFPFVKNIAKSEVVHAGTEIDELDLSPEILASMIKAGHLVSTTDKKAQKVPTVQKLDLESQIPQATKHNQSSVEPVSGTKVAETKIPGITDDQPTQNSPQGQGKRGRPSRN
jgi:hypothetical protein